MIPRLAVPLALCLLGCGGSKSRDAADLAGTTDLSAQNDADDGQCNALSLDGVDDIPVAVATGDGPDLTGGTPLDGTYRLSAQTLYGTQVDGGVDAFPSEKVVLVLASGVLQINSSAVEPAPVMGLFGKPYTANFSVNSSAPDELYVPTTCGEPSGKFLVFGVPFSATPTMLTLAVGGAGTTLIDVFTKQ